MAIPIQLRLPSPRILLQQLDPISSSPLLFGIVRDRLVMMLSRCCSEINSLLMVFLPLTPALGLRIPSPHLLLQTAQQDFHSLALITPWPGVSTALASMKPPSFQARCRCLALPQRLATAESCVHGSRRHRSLLTVKPLASSALMPLRHRAGAPTSWSSARIDFPLYPYIPLPNRMAQSRTWRGALCRRQTLPVLAPRCSRPR